MIFLRSPIVVRRAVYGDMLTLRELADTRASDGMLRCLTDDLFLTHGRLLGGFRPENRVTRSSRISGP